MAAGTLPRPGTEHGPCESECRHRDCDLTRRMAAAACTRCGKPIGFEVWFYDVTRRDGRPLAEQPLALVHAACEENVCDEADRAMRDFGQGEGGDR